MCGLQLRVGAGVGLLGSRQEGRLQLLSDPVVLVADVHKRELHRPEL